MSLLKNFGTILFVSSIVGLVIFLVEGAAYRRGKADAAAICAAQSEALHAKQLAEVERLNAKTLAAVEEGNRAAARAEKQLASDMRNISTTFEELHRAPSIPVLADCRRSFDAVRLYQYAAAGPAAGDREVQAAAGPASLGDDPVPRPGDAGDR
jgi:hypothetical protein